ncbi:oxidoreductase [Halomonas sp. C05BenzN]|uniref:oxidoreductase n=1 Tax=Halomonas sp. C05BenzN TaxID=3411041 RepID=UPI003B932ABA
MRQRVSSCVLLGLVVAVLLSSIPVAASSLPEPTGEVILTVTGDIDHPNVGDEARFDRDMLMAISPRVVETHTPWHGESGRYEGPLFRAVLAAVGANGDRIRVRALNDYEAEIPVSDLHDYDVILAMTRNGKEMAIRDFGPLFVLYPFDDHPELLTETIRFRSVWQVGYLHVH